MFERYAVMPWTYSALQHLDNVVSNRDTLVSNEGRHHRETQF